MAAFLGPALGSGDKQGPGGAEPPCCVPLTPIVMQRTACWLLNRFIRSSAGLVRSSRNAPARPFCAVLRRDTTKLCAINTDLTPSSGCQVPRGIPTAEAVVCRSRSQSGAQPQFKHGSIWCNATITLQNPLTEGILLVISDSTVTSPGSPSQKRQTQPWFGCAPLRFGRGMCPYEKACCFDSCVGFRRHVPPLPLLMGRSFSPPLPLKGKVIDLAVMVLVSNPDNLFIAQA